jgi:hypothetical protein
MSRHATPRHAAARHAPTRHAVSYSGSRRAGRRLGALTWSAIVCLGGGGALMTVGLISGPAGADATLGGFTVTALAEGVTAQYEQPNLPLPATPSLEFDEGYAATTDNFGPTGAATASTFYPGQVVANAGPELALLVPGVPLPPAPVWPIEAVSDYPQTPNTASDDQPGVNMDATSTADANTATAALGDDAPGAGASGSQSTPTTAASSGNALAASSPILGIAGISGTSTSQAPAAKAISTATATDSGISILNGFISIGSVTSSATATSDGTTGSVSGSTVLSNASIDGEAVTIDANGISAAGNSAPLAVPVSTLNTLLKTLGVTVSVTNPTDTVLGASASRTLDGLSISINLTTLDAAVNKLGALLPASLTSQFPVPLPNEQIVTIDLGTVSVSSAASPPFDDTGTDAGTAPALGSFTGSFGGGDTGGSSFGGGSTPSTTATSSTPTPDTGGSVPVVATTPVFTGVGAGLLLLGLVAAAALAFAGKRVDDLSELAGPVCASGDPLHTLFEGEPTVDDLGGAER